MKPLSGLKVLDLSRVLAGPLCTMILADLGAEVVKVEPPWGDETRGWGPPFVEGESAYFLAVNRGKRSVALDLKRPEGQEAVRRLAQKAEVEYVGVRCGIMDQMAASLGQPGQALFLDTRTLAYENLPLPPGVRVAVLDLGLGRRLAEAGYNRRRQEAEEAAKRLGVRSLRDVADLCLVESLPSPLDRRARHVVSENLRVLRGVEALRRQDARAFGELMTQSHRSLAQDYEVSLPELDALVEEALRAGAYGAKLTGAGFGGAVVALVAESRFPAFREALARRFPDLKVL